ncbi:MULTISPECIES: hypothetical protein [unclassified Sphingopyxis]|uniref:hypothetical protein n=1 Tax=unclassified Sphingopyxis TaxID=2614943 RepID=UPI00285A2F2B|nr:MULTISPECIES: hypothetical protein [unclassified Sphingopyxis]MDR7061201.1 hypothetical protein [Sphingopyxis sp. BE235]MDR7182068.1 hypothetical protein [Sphingopyxis sp. BE249]
MSARRYLLGAIVPLALVGIVTAANTPAPAVKESWRAIVEHADGNSDIVEHGVTLSDCMAALQSHTAAPVTYCEREPHNPPRFIGLGCDGAAGPLYAVEESDFPTCARIERL